LQDAKDHLAKVGNAKQIALCDKFLWHGKFRNDKDMNAYFKAMDPLYFYSGKKRKKPSTKNISLGELKSFLSYDVLNAGFGGFLHHFNFIPKLKKITAPTLVLAGKNDWICVPKQSKIIAENIPNAQLKIFNKCSHALTTDANKRYVREVRRFLRQH
jgi:proline iminopeptidase